MSITDRLLNIIEAEEAEKKRINLSLAERMHMDMVHAASLNPRYNVEIDTANPNTLSDAMPSSDGALRYDDKKPRWDLLPGDAMAELVQVYTMGAEKYAPRNWEKGMNWSRCFASLMRHAWAFWRGEDYDRESGLHHMAHVAWNALALVSYSRRGVGADDRGKA